MNPKSLPAPMLAPAISMHAHRTHQLYVNGDLKECEAEIDELVKMATELSRRIRQCLDEEMMK